MFDLTDAFKDVPGMVLHIEEGDYPALLVLWRGKPVGRILELRLRAATNIYRGRPRVQMAIEKNADSFEYKELITQLRQCFWLQVEEVEPLLKEHR